MTDSPPLHRRIRSFVVRAGRMTAGQEKALQELWPVYGIDTADEYMDLARIFGREAFRMLEIGFGTGDAIFNYAQLHPDHDCLGIEVHPPGVGHLLIKTKEAGLTNVRVICRDAVEVLERVIPPSSINEVHIFFPDPWHKKRHHKRRLIQPSFIDLLARALKIGGIVKMATDWENYAEQMLQVTSADARFINMALDSTASPSAFAARPDHRPLTRFERRGHRLGHGVWDLAFRRQET